MSEAQTQTDPIVTPSETGESFEELLAYLTTESQRIRHQTRMVQRGMWSVVGFVVVAGIFLGIAKGEWDFTSLVSMTGLCGAGIAMASTDKMKGAARQLSQYNDVRAVGAFVEALEWSDKDIASLAEGKLLELLPRLQASDAHLLTKEQRDILNRKLLTADGDFIKAILQAYEQVGDSSAIPAVEKLTRGEGKAGVLPDVVEAAKACLPALIERAKQQEQAQTLLRAAHGNTTAPETLLRPAHATLESQPETLLRPTQI